MSFDRVFLESLEDAKAEDIVCLNVVQKTSFADFMIIASGRSSRHIKSIADSLVKAVKNSGQKLQVRLEGEVNSGWLLVDTGDVIAHIFLPERRQFYNIEEIWG